MRDASPAGMLDAMRRPPPAPTRRGSRTSRSPRGARPRRWCHVCAGAGLLDEESVRIEARLIPRPRRGDVRPIRFRRANAFSKMGRNQLPPKGGPHSHPGGRISSINRSFAASNGLTKLTPRKFKAVLQVLGKQMANTGPLCRGP